MMERLGKKVLPLDPDMMQRLLLMLRHAGGWEELERQTKRPRLGGGTDHAYSVELHKPVVTAVMWDGPRLGKAALRLRVLRGRFFSLGRARSWSFVYEVPVPYYDLESAAKVEKIRRGLEKSFGSLTRTPPPSIGGGR